MRSAAPRPWRKRMFRLAVAFLLLAAAPAVAHAQEEGISKAKAEKMQAKKEKDDAKEVKKEEKRLLKLHRKHQDKATRKRMKQHKSRADNNGPTKHRDPFLRRLFGSKH